MKKLVLGLLAPLGATLLVNGGAANATTVTINVGGTDYNVTAVTDTFADLLTTYGNPPSRMPWYNDSSLADSFATALNDQLGDQLVDQSGTGFTLSPLFGYSESSGTTTFSAWDIEAPTLYSAGDVDSATEYIYAILEPVTPPVATPGPVPLLGAAAAFSASRRLRRRISRQTFTL
jgi:hypothetical protein